MTSVVARAFRPTDNGVISHGAASSIISLYTTRDTLHIFDLNQQGVRVGTARFDVNTAWRQVLEEVFTDTRQMAQRT
jgi:hypothetical protein